MNNSAAEIYDNSNEARARQAFLRQNGYPDTCLLTVKLFEVWDRRVDPPKRTAWGDSSRDIYVVQYEG